MAFQLPKGDPDKSLEVLGELPDDIPEKETLLIEQRLRRIYGRVSQLPRKRPEVPVTNKHPDDPRIFSAVRELDICWSFGIEPLATQIYINARGHRNKVNAEKRAANEKVPDPKSDPHRHILDDFEKDNSKLVSWHIASVDRRVITALIRGDIAVQEHNDPEFAGLIYDNHRLQFRPGTYINVVARRQRVDGQEQPYVGRGLSYNEWSETFDSFKDYLKFDNDATTQSNAWAQKVDQMYPLWTLENQQLQHHRDERHYCKNSSQETQLREFIEIGEKVWLRPLKAIWLQDPKDPHLDIPYARCPIESGWAIYVADRGHGHVTQKATNYLLGLVLAILKALWGERFEMKQYQIFKVIAPLQAPIAECLVSELTRCYWYQRGLNPDLAGWCKFLQMWRTETWPSTYARPSILVVKQHSLALTSIKKIRVLDVTTV